MTDSNGETVNAATEAAKLYTTTKYDDTTSTTIATTTTAGFLFGRCYTRKFKNG